MATVKFSKQNIEPNPLEVDYWIDVKSNPYGGILKYHNGVDWVPLNETGGSGDGSGSSFDYYTKEQVNALLSGKADSNSVDSKVDDTEFAKVIQNVGFREIGDNQMEMVMSKYDGATTSVTVPIASENNPGMLSGKSFKDFVKQSQLQEVYNEMYQVVSDLSFEERERNEAEQQREANDKLRQTAEQNRFVSENSRQYEEAKRVENETNRENTENNRRIAEILRQQAEENRTSTFNVMKDEMNVVVQEGQETNALSAAATARANTAAKTIEDWESVVITTEDIDDVNGVEADVTNEAIRKTPQTLSASERKQARLNIGAVSDEENTAFKTEVNTTVNSVITDVLELNTKVDNIKPTIINGDVVNAADEEDITSEDGLLKLKDRDFLNGMGYVVLRRNKSFKEQVTKVNTIYEIRYDFELNDDTVHIPNNCVLTFVGGSLNNGKISGNNTVIKSNSRCFTNVVCLGSFSCEGQAKWFVDKSYIKTEEENHVLVKNDSTSDIQKLLDSSFANIVFDSGLYYIENTIYIRKSVSIFMQGKGIEKMTKIKDNPINQTSIFTDKDIDMLVIDCYGEATDKNISIVGGSFDFTLCEKNSHNCITVDLTKENTRIWGLNIDVDINGCFVKNSTTGFFESTGIKFSCLDSDISNGSYATMIRISGNLNTLFCGIDITRTKATWITDVHINSIFEWCVSPIISNASVFRYNGSIQTAAMFNLDNNHLYPCIDLIGGDDIHIGGKIWDVGVIETAHQEAIRIGDAKNVYLNGTYYDFLINAVSRRLITGNLSAITNNHYISRDNYVDNNAYEIKGSDKRNSFEALDLRGGSISAKYINVSGIEEDVLDANNLSNVFYVNKTTSTIQFKNNPSDDGKGFIEIVISNDSNLYIYAQYVSAVLLANNRNPACEEVEIIKEYDNTQNSHSMKILGLVDVLQSYIVEARSNNAINFRRIIIRLKGLKKVNEVLPPIYLYKVICTDSFDRYRNTFYSLLPVSGGTIYGDLAIEGFLNIDNVNLGFGTYLSASSEKLIKYGTLNLQPIHAFNSTNVAPWAVRGQMAYQNINGRPVWRNEKAHDSSNPLAGWSDALGNPANAKLNGQTSERPSGVNKGFTYFDTTLNKPIWWTGTAWVDSTGTNV